jgi:hypothetical protein
VGAIEKDDTVFGSFAVSRMLALTTRVAVA